MEYPLVVALIITYRRLPLALATIRAVKQYIDYPNLGFHIADDGSGQEYTDTLRREIGDDYHVTLTDSRRGGVGMNMNMGIDSCLQRADMWLHLEDDWELRQPLDLRPCVQMLLENESIGMIRLGYISPGVTGELVSAAGKLWWKLHKNSDTFVYTGHAALKHRRFFNTYQYFAEGIPPGLTEIDYCSRFNSNGGPEIVWPAWLPDMIFHSIGCHQSFKVAMESEGLTAEQAAERFEAMNQVAV